MQLTLDNRAAAAERLILKLEDMGYRFRPTKYGYAYLWPEEGADIESLMELSKYRKEASLYLSQRGKIYSRICRDIAKSGRVL